MASLEFGLFSVSWTNAYISWWEAYIAVAMVHVLCHFLLKLFWPWNGGSCGVGGNVCSGASYIFSLVVKNIDRE